ncbi:hypothetical protein FEM48_Zijuj11G0056600 [Ziziphus jujuba var. spinosa]|uniref:adenine phosphoribosyltransferase n=1 Tax=Ziziphus jujuba var. spinosa TaxID=714518 RepID=A0A978UH53_ZIZJJ|nr:hypothetical protein FEM48_Zijuj11G0056600 [Ziziphus jujuba var. spinosa]
MSAYRVQDPRIHGIKTKIRVVPNFPKPGLLLFFVFLLHIILGLILGSCDVASCTQFCGFCCFKLEISYFSSKCYWDLNCSLLFSMHGLVLSGDCAEIFPFAFPGIEARGFIFGPPIALAIGAKFVPLRKPKKLPGEVIFEEYTLEYGKDRLEMHVGAVEPGERALVVDDLIATGGTLCAAMNLLGKLSKLYSDLQL